jgi:GrpB-like predicted nucleotidyltransferase (UPF0157 family)
MASLPYFPGIKFSTTAYRRVRQCKEFITLPLMKIIILPYNSEWPGLFNEERARLKRILHSLSPVIEHIGSTAVPGMCAKPVIDILVGLPSYDDIVQASQLMQLPGYVYIKKYEDVMPFRRYFVKVNVKNTSTLPQIIFKGEDTPAVITDQRTHHIHIVEINSPFWKEQLLFRNHLRKHEHAREAYTILKEKLAQQEWKNSDEYAAAKAKFIQSVIQQAIFNG